MPFMKRSFEAYMRDYKASHSQRGTQVTHMLGIPMIIASVPLLPFNPLLGGGLFVGGWILQLIGHYYFEHNDPQFFGDPFNLLVGVAWTACEWADLIGVKLPVPGAY